MVILDSPRIEDINIVELLQIWTNLTFFVFWTRRLQSGLLVCTGAEIGDFRKSGFEHKNMGPKPRHGVNTFPDFNHRAFSDKERSLMILMNIIQYASVDTLWAESCLFRPKSPDAVFPWDSWFLSISRGWIIDFLINSEYLLWLEQLPDFDS